MSALDVALVSFKFPPRFSGYGNQLYAVSRQIAERNEQLISFVVVSSASRVSDCPKGISRLVNLSPLWIEKLGPRVEFYWFVVCLLGWLIRYRRTYRVIHCVKAGPESAMCLLVSALLRKPVIVKVAQDEIRLATDPSASGWKRFLRRRRILMLRRAAAIVAISRQIEQELVTSGVPRRLIHCISNGADASRFRPIHAPEERLILRRRLGLVNDAVIGLFVGSLSRRKGVDSLISALREIRTNETFQFVFCGPDYELSEDVRRECSRSGSAGRPALSMAGNVSNVEEYMRAADFIVLPSLSEGLPNVLLEASLTGLAIVGTDIGGVRDVVEAMGNGILVPVGDADALSAAIARLINDGAYRASLRSHTLDRALDMYALDKVAERYHALYSEVSS